MFGIRAIVETHIVECKEERRIVAEQFTKIQDKLDKRFQETDRLREQQHAENQAALGKIQRYIYMMIGGATLLGFLTSDWGRGLLVLLESGQHHS